MVDRPQRDETWVRRRAEGLRAKDSSTLDDRVRIARLCNGGPDAVKELLGRRQLGDQILAPHLLLSGLTRLAQKLHNLPAVKVTPESDRPAAKERATQIETLVRFHDSISRADLQMPQLARWVPAFGFAPIVVTERRLAGFRFAASELRDPLDCFPGYWGPDQEPTEMAVFRKIDLDALERFAPKAAQAVRSRRLDGARAANGGIMLDQFQPSHQRGFEGSGDTDNMTGLIEYWSLEGTYYLLTETDTPLHFVPNPLTESTAFVVPRRFAVDRLSGQYDHVIGLMAALAKLNLLGIINIEDSTLAPTNIAGQLRGGEKYKVGRFKVNYLEPGTVVDRPTSPVPFQVWTQIDRLERQFRIGAGYPVTDDAQSPNAFVTGRGLEELTTAANNEVAEYRKIIAQAWQDIDTKRLAYEELQFGGTTRPLIGRRGEKVGRRTFDPARLLNGRWTTRRIFGVLSGFDEPQKLVAGSGMLASGTLSLESFLEEIDGIEDEAGEMVRIRRYAAERALMQRWAANPDPAVDALLARVFTEPSRFESIVAELVPPEEPPAEEEAALAAAAPSLGSVGPPPSITTVLNQLNSSGQVEGGIQTVGRS